MILVAGGTGRLGTRVVPLLRGRGEEVRVLTCDHSRAGHLTGIGVEVVEGDVRDAAAVRNMTMAAFVETFRSETGSSGSVRHIPPPMMRLAAIAMRLVNPGMARQIQMGTVMDTRPQAFDAMETRRRHPSIPLTCLDEVVSRDFANRPTVRSTWS